MKKMVIIVLSILSLLMAACQSPMQPAVGGTTVLAVESFLADMAQAVAGDRLKVESLIPVPAPRARGVARLTQAPVVSAPAARAASAKLMPDARAKVIESLQRMGEKRPAKRKGLERHIESHLGRNLEPGQLETLMSQLERDGVLVFNDKNKVEYRLPKAKK